MNREKPDVAPDAKEITAWLVNRLAGELRVDPDAIEIDQPLTRLGIDSTEAVVLSGEMQDWLGRKISPTVIWDFPTIEELARHLASG